MPIDPVFELSYSLLDYSEPAFGEGDAATAQYLWCLSLHEGTAASLCALSMYEFDGMPLDFYRDMAKQAWDETRHARFFLRASKTFLGEAAASPRAPAGLRALHGRVFSAGKGLPVPAEGNLYEVFWNADLVERLVLMNLDTETPGVASLRRYSKSKICVERSWLKDGFRLIARDEATHARSGQQWLEFLVPSAEDRMEAHEAARAMRGFLLASSFAHLRQHGGLIKVLDRISSDAFASLASVRVPFAAYAENK